MKFSELITLASALAPSSFFGGLRQAQAPVAIAGHTFEPTQAVISVDKAPADFVRMHNLSVISTISEVRLELTISLQHYHLWVSCLRSLS